MEAVNHQRLLMKKVRSLEGQYNPERKMLKVPFKTNGYHTTLTNTDYVHATYPSLSYAAALLDTGLPEYEQRAFDIIETLCSMQDTDPSRPTFGIWSWYYEEPLSQMSPPDWNWADFCGKQLISAISRHEPRFPEALRRTVRQTVYNACDAIIKRNVGPHYTNIAIMGSYVTLHAGQYYERSDYLEYGLQRLEKLYQFTKRLNAFQEYNSPTYAVVSILELSKIRKEIKLERARELCGELLDLAWRMVAEHFHVRTGEWAGPHSRSYRTLLSDEHKSFLQVATKGQVMFFPWDSVLYATEWYNSGVECPDAYIGLFLQPETRTVRQLYFRNESAELEKWATTYLAPEFALGTFSREIMWNQCRNLVAYVHHNGRTTFLHLRFLHNGYDYCSAQFRSVQHQGDVLFGIHFLAKGGDTHPFLDPMNGSVEAKDLRLRFELGGDLDHVFSLTSEDVAGIGIAGLLAKVEVKYAAFVEERGVSRSFRWEVLKEGDRYCLDYVIYAGESRKFDFLSMEKAAFLFLFSLGQSDASLADWKEEDGHIVAEARFGEFKGSFRMPLKPVVG